LYVRTKQLNLITLQEKIGIMKISLFIMDRLYRRKRDTANIAEILCVKQSLTLKKSIPQEIDFFNLPFETPLGKRYYGIHSVKYSGTDAAGVTRKSALANWCYVNS
jgi:hypothetical protein